MVCIYCGSSTAVKNSRLQRHSNHIWRRRVCEVCGSIFTTIERPELSGALMVGNASTSHRKLQPFSRDKLFLTIYESCKHRQNALNEATSLAQTIINNLVAKQRGGIIARKLIVEETYLVLGRFDKTAATFYAAYHGA